MTVINKKALNKYLLFKHHLLPESKTDSIIQIAADLCGLHATVPTTPYLSLFIRMHNFSKADLNAELETEKTLIRFRSMRNTLHLLPVKQYPRIFSFTRELTEKRLVQYMKYIGLSREKYNSLANKVVITLSKEGHTASEIKKETGNNKFINHVINMLCDEAAIVRGKIAGSWKSNKYRYYRFKDFFPEIENRGVCEENTVDMFVKDYIGTYGPVSEIDIIWWSGLNKKLVEEILKRITDRLIKIRITEFPGNLLMLKQDYQIFQEFRTSDDVAVSFLPAFDPYIIGCKNRSRVLNELFADYVYDRFGNAAPTIISDGEIKGIWDVDDDKNLVGFYLFKPVDNYTYEKIVEAAANIGKFYCDSEVDIVELRSITPVKDLTVGSFVSPLKHALKIK